MPCSFNVECMNHILRQKGGSGRLHVTLAFDEHDIHRYNKKDRENLIKTIYDKETAYRERHMVAQIVDAHNVAKKAHCFCFP